MHYFFFIALLLFPVPSFAAEFTLGQPSDAVRVGDIFTTSFSLHTGTDVINAIEGSVHFPPSLSLTDVRLQGSLISLWLSSPAEKEKGIVSFAGVLPGGYQGEAKIFTLVFKAVQKGSARLSFGAGTAAYQNDGKGTIAKLSLSPLSVPVGTSLGTSHTVTFEEDALPPESFMPVISSGEPFGLSGLVLIFSTQDKNSGIERYDIARSYSPRAKEDRLSWRVIESPYVLVSGDSTRYLYVRAVDREGNTRVEVVSPQEFSSIAFVFTWWVLILVVAVGGVILLTRFYRR